jgi:hypothetical protein
MNSLSQYFQSYATIMSLLEAYGSHPILATILYLPKMSAIYSVDRLMNMQILLAIDSGKNRVADRVAIEAQNR